MIGTRTNWGEQCAVVVVVIAKKAAPAMFNLICVENKNNKKKRTFPIFCFVLISFDDHVFIEGPRFL